MFRFINSFFGQNLYLFYNQILPPLTNLFLAFWISNSIFSEEKDSYAILITIISISLVFFGFNSKSIVQNKANDKYIVNLENAKFINLTFSFFLLIFSLFFLNKYILLVTVVCFHCISELTIEFYKQSIPKLNLVSFSRVKSVLSYTFPLLIYSGSIILFTMGDRFLLDYFSIDELYTYFLMSTLANGNILLTSALMPVILDKSISLKNYSFNRDLINWTQNIILLVVLVSIFVFSLRLLDLVILDNNWFFLYLLLSISSIFQLPYFFSIQGLLARGKTSVLIPIGISALAISFIFNLILINYLGVYGSCVTSIITSLWISYKALRL